MILVGSPLEIYSFLVVTYAQFLVMAVGKLPINQVNPEQKEKFLAQESGKRRDHLQKFLTACSASQVYDDDDDAISFPIGTVVLYTILI